MHRDTSDHVMRISPPVVTVKISANNAVRPSCAIKASPKAVSAAPAPLAENGITSMTGIASEISGRRWR